MTPEEVKKENLKKKILLGAEEAFEFMNGFQHFGGKIIISVDRPILLEKRVVKVTFFGEKTGQV